MASSVVPVDKWICQASQECPEEECFAERIQEKRHEWRWSPAQFSSKEAGSPACSHQAEQSCKAKGRPLPFAACHEAKGSEKGHSVQANTYTGESNATSRANATATATTATTAAAAAAGAVTAAAGAAGALRDHHLLSHRLRLHCATARAVSAAPIAPRDCFGRSLWLFENRQPTVRVTVRVLVLRFLVRVRLYIVTAV